MGLVTICSLCQHSFNKRNGGGWEGCQAEWSFPVRTLQRQNTEISKQIFPEKEYWGLSPNFHIHASVSDLYIPTIGLPILLEEICRPILGLYKSLSDTWMLKLGLRLRYSQKSIIHKWNFPCSAWAMPRKIVCPYDPALPTYSSLIFYDI